MCFFVCHSEQSEESLMAERRDPSPPLGLAFIPKESWSQNMQGDLLVGYHGSWNRSVPTGYKIDVCVR